MPKALTGQDGWVNRRVYQRENHAADHALDIDGNPALFVVRKAPTTVFDFGEWRSEGASRKNPDASLSFVTITPGNAGAEFVVGNGSQRTLILRDNQHEYIFAERSTQPASPAIRSRGFDPN